MQSLSSRASAIARRTRSLFRSPESRLGMSVLAAALLFVSVDAAVAHGYKLGAIEIGHPWSRATPPGAKVGGGYLTLTNDGDTPDTLVAATIVAADRAEIHEMKVEDGIMKMRPLEGGLPLPAHTAVKLDPSGVHLMFIDLKQPLVQGTKVKGTLTFAKAGTVDVEFMVDAIGASAKEMKHEDMQGAKDMQGGKDMPGMTMDP